jgi:hypothetical protein
MRQRKPLFNVMFAAVLAMAVSACSNPEYLIHPASDPAVTHTREAVDNAVASSLLQPLRWGSYFFPAKGAMFKPVLPVDSRNAMVYVYRPQSKWNDEEIQSPGFFINGKFISGLKSGSYFWFEVPASRYYFSAQRPLIAIYFSSIFEVTADFEGGQNYYFRYDEENLGPEKPAKGAALLVVGPLHQIPEAQALTEISKTRSMGVGKVLLADNQPQWAPFDLYPDAKPVQASSLDALTGTPRDVSGNDAAQTAQSADAHDGSVPASSTVKAKPESHWWNPATWF